MKYVVSQVNFPRLVVFLSNNGGLCRTDVGSGNLINNITKNYLLSKENADKVIKLSKTDEAITFFGEQLNLEITEVKNWKHFIKLKNLRGEF